MWSKNPTIFCLFIFSLLLAVVNVTRPLMPIDETRYLTVAWEYYVRQAWVLPTLNFEPYSHKPPMLFWLINGLWQLFGSTEIWVARLVTLIGAMGSLFLMHRIGRVLWPHTPGKADFATLMLVATPFFLLYSTLIMFDTLLSVCVLLGVYAVLKAYLTSENKYWILLGIAFGLGALVKGPVILIHLVPLMLASPYWHKDFKVSHGFWWGGLLLALAIGVGIGLLWALPAAKIGGPEYEKMIFWGQSAGRMVKAFDHARPFWFYFALFPALLAPWIFMPTFWRRGEKPDERDSWQTRFLLSWVFPVFVSFCLISGKQAHYLLPLLPGIFLLIAQHHIIRNLLESISPARLYLWAILPMLIFSLLLLSGEHLIDIGIFPVGHDIKSKIDLLSDDGFAAFILLSLFLLLLLYVRRKSWGLHASLRAIAFSSVLFVVAIHVSLDKILMLYYDLRPISAVIQPDLAQGAPVAVARQWQGEIGYLAKLKKSVTVVQADEIDDWLAQHPNGLVIFRGSEGDDLTRYQVLFKAPYRSAKKFIAVLKSQANTTAQ